MTIGLKINVRGETELINYEVKDLLNKFVRFIESRGIGIMECFDFIHDIDIEDGLLYLFYGYTIGYNNFNHYEFPRNNVYGDAFIICINPDRELVDINMDILLNYLDGEDLDDTIVEDENELYNTSDEDTSDSDSDYQLSDSFIAVEDDVEDDEDFLSFVDYP